MFQPWLLRKVYRELNLYNSLINDYFSRLINFSKSGWKHALQRITEWSNLAIITEIIGAWSTEGLLAVEPSILVLTLCNLLSQGFGQASMMIAAQDYAALKKAMKNFYATVDEQFLIEAKDLKNKLHKNFFISCGAGLTFNLIISGSLYFMRDEVADIYIPAGTNESVYALADTLLWINILSLLPDAIRVIAGGIDRGWGDLLVPTLMSLFLMSAIGIPVGYGISMGFNESLLPLFIARIVALVFSAVFNGYRFYTHTHADAENYNSMVFYRDLMNALTAYSGPESALPNEKEPVAALFPKNDRIFDVVSLALNAEQNAADIKKIAAQHIKDNIRYYEKITNYDKKNILNLIQNGGENAEDLIFMAIAKAMKISIVIVNSNGADPIILGQASERRIYLSRDENGGYQLQQTLSDPVLLAKINSTVITTFEEDVQQKQSRWKKPVSFFGSNSSRLSMGKAVRSNQIERQGYALLANEGSSAFSH